ncbi:molybdate transport system ATP-binding protein [Desulfuromusa kysingii]|uniref:Molybdate transport system ATP-binding protein n=1 Tax=Desulfuromusa kysingii TaxID=37625 RepID=A0A1H4ANX2_9BACT|nr:molybdate ABC transporter ATP-binding protein ModF [Desulfuromusa kysingii]SEA37364.1 molybdate transport system ATP-binding protein [Desulfuromusa kysingii]
MKIKFTQLQAQSTSFTLTIDNWTIEEQQSWGVFSTEGDIGSLLGDLLCEESCCCSGHILKGPGHIAQVSLAEQQRLLEQEIANDDSDFLDHIDMGSTVYTLIYQQCHNAEITSRLLSELDLSHLQDRGFRALSSGESRRLILARALATQPDLLLLDKPYAGLDVAHRKSLAQYLTRLSRSIQMLIIVSRETEMPEWIEKIALFSRGKLDSLMDKATWDVHPVVTQIKAQSKEQGEQIMALIRQHRHTSEFSDPLFALTNGRVAYTDKVIFSDVTWRINQGEHWQVRGPNGCGKSTLLGMIFGDHPQCYSNDIQIFGKQRGSGETIWEIKQHIGMVSSALHLQYRVDCSALKVIISGFYDSIGLYQKPTKRQQNIAHEWLAILHMSQFADTSFRKLEYGQQRLLLIARALVKQPTLLILDEPYQGLDYLGRRLIKNALELIAREHLSQLLYVSHYQDDSLESIHNYLDFVPAEDGLGYKTIVS